MTMSSRSADMAIMDNCVYNVRGFELSVVLHDRRKLKTVKGGNT